MQTERQTGDYIAPTRFSPQPLSAAELALAAEGVQDWLMTHDGGSAKWRDMQRVRIRLMHHQAAAEGWGRGAR